MAIIYVKGNYPTIQAAVDAAEPGDEILVKDGIYHEQVTISKNFIKITGGKKTILDGNMNLDTGIILNNTSGVEITSLIIKNYRNDGIDILGSGTMNTITKTHIEKINYYGIYLDTATTSNKITGCSILGSYYGVYDFGSYLCMENSKILFCWRGICTELSANHTRIERCIFYKNSTGIILHGIWSRITGNRLHKNTNSGIICYTGCLIEDNKVTETLQLGGILIEAQYHAEKGTCTVRRNWVCSSGTQGIMIDSGNNHTIVDNEVYDNHQEGIIILTEGNTIMGNKAERNGKYDIARVRANNRICDNECEKSLPPWICENDRCGEDDLLLVEDCAKASIKVPSDYPTIQAAVDAANPGDLIFVESGVYHEQVTINKSFIKIFGGKKTVLDGKMRLDTGLILRDTNGVEMKSLIIKNYRSDGINILGNGSKNVVSNIRILNINYSGILLGEGTSCNRIERSVIEGTYNGIEDRGSSSYMEECKIRWNGNYGVFISGMNAIINQSIVSNNYDTGISSSGNSAKVASSTITANGYYGIELLDNSVAEENEVSNNAKHGIMLVGNNSIVKSNRILSNAEYGIYVLNRNYVIGNSINDNLMVGIIAAANCIIEGNSATGNKWYDLVRRHTSSIIQNNNCDKYLPPWLGNQCEEEFVSRNPICEQVIASIRVPDDYPTIQLAVDAAMPGEVILVRNGIYHEEVTIHTSYVTIIGEDQTILDGERKRENGLTVRDANGVTIRSLTLKNYNAYGIGILGSSKESIITNVCIISANYGIHLDTQTSNAVISDCNFVGGVFGIYNFSNNLYMENCRVAYNGSTGIFCVSDQFCVKNSYVYSNFGNGINCQKQDGREIIKDCILYGNRYTCINSYGTSLIKGNELYGNLSSCIGAVGPKSIVEENIIHSNEGEGIIVGSAVAIIRNKVYDNERGGIYFNSYAYLNFVEGNTAQNNKEYDMVGLRANSIFKGNICDESLPPWICCEGDLILEINAIEDMAINNREEML